MRISQIKMRISHIRVFAKFTNYKILNSAILIAIFNYQCCIYCCLLLAALTGISNGSGLVKVYVFVVIINCKFVFSFQWCANGTAVAHSQCACLPIQGLLLLFKNWLGWSEFNVEFVVLLKPAPIPGVLGL